MKMNVQYSNVDPAGNSRCSVVDGKKTVTFLAADVAAGGVLQTLLRAALNDSAVCVTDFDRFVFPTNTLAANVTHSLVAGTVVGQRFEIVILGTQATSDVVVTLSSCTILGATSTTITADAAGEGCNLVWDGACWVGPAGVLS